MNVPRRMVWETQTAARWKAQQYEKSELRGKTEGLGAVEAPTYWAASQGSGGSKRVEESHQEDHKVIVVIIILVLVLDIMSQ